MEISKSRHGSPLGLDHQVAKQAIESQNYVFAGEVLGRLLEENPSDIEALLLMGTVLADTGKSWLALSVAEKVCRLAPKDFRGWMMAGWCESGVLDIGAIKSLKRADELNPNDPGVMRCLAFAYAMNFEFELAEKYARRAIPMEPHPQGHAALGFAMLYKKQYGEGWDEYAKGMGHQKWRAKKDFGLPDWEGQPGKILVYGEQGLGDQIAFASAIPGTQAHEVVCMKKLHKLMERSLDCAVYVDSDEITWQPTSDYQCSMSEFLRFTRRNVASFPGTPYLFPHPEKQFQWKALFRAISKRKKVGIAWTGGIRGSHGWRTRNLPLEAFLPVFGLDADIVSLEYKDRHEEIDAFCDKHNVMLHDFPWATQTDDYDDAAALVSCLDAVITVPSTGYHLAGALGIPAVVLVHDRPHWHESTPWWGSVDFLNRDGDYIQKAIGKLRNKCEFLSESTHAVP